MARIAFVQNLAFEYLGVMYLSSLLKNNGHCVEVFIEYGQGIDRLIKEAGDFKPDIIGFPCTSGIHRWAKAAARLFKNICPKSKIIFGGPHPTFFPDIIEDESVDIICRGEGEYTLLDLAGKIEKGQDYSGISNLWVKKKGCVFRNDVRPLIENLDELPFPDRNLYIRKYPFLNKSQKAFIAGRGCPFSCTYCFNHAFKKIYQGKGNMVRLRSVDNIISEIKEVESGGRLKTVYIQDDTFALNKIWTLEFLEKYRSQVRLPFICMLRADLVDEEVVKNLKSAGCLNVFFGIETGSQNLRNLLLKKSITDGQIYETAALLKKYKIRFRTYNMFGLPGESLEDAFKTVELNIKIKTDYPWSSLLQPFPGTEIREYAKEHDMLEEDACGFEPSFFKKSNIKLKEKTEIENLHRLFFYAVKFPFLLPLIKKGIKIKLDLFYNLLFLWGYMYSFKKSEGISLLDTLLMAKNNIKNFIFNRDLN